MREDTSILYDKIIELEEEIATLRAENLELRTEEEDESEPYRYAQQIIESKNIDEIQNEIQWHNEVAEYLEVYLGYNQTADAEEDEE